jgi:hypothetical protein
MPKNFNGTIAISTIWGIMLIVSAFATAVALVAIFEGNIGFGGSLSQKSYLVAESGIYDAILRLARDRNNVSAYNLTVEDGVASVTFDTAPTGYPADHIKIISTGDVQNRKRKIEVIVYADSQTGEIRIISWRELSI